MICVLTLCFLSLTGASLVAQMVKGLPELQETQVQSLGQEDPRRRKWQPTPVLLPGKFHRQRRLAGYSPWGCKELDTTEQLTHISLTVKGHTLKASHPWHVLQLFGRPVMSNSLWPQDCSTEGLPVPHHLLKFAQVHAHCIGDAIQPRHALTPSSASALNLSRHHRLWYSVM